MSGQDLRVRLQEKLGDDFGFPEIVAELFELSEITDEILANVIRKLASES